MKVRSLVNNILLRYKMVVKFLSNLGVFLLIAFPKCKRFEHMFFLFPHGIYKGIYQKNLVFLFQFRGSYEPLETLLPNYPAAHEALLSQVSLAGRAFQHFT